MIKRLWPVFHLTVAEQRMVIFLLSAVVAVVAAKSYRDVAINAVPAEASLPAADQPSPSPGIRP